MNYRTFLNNNRFRVIVGIVIGCTVVRMLTIKVGNESKFEKGYTVFKHSMYSDDTVNSFTEESVKMITKHDQEKGNVYMNREKRQHYPNTVTNGHIYWNDEIEKLIPKGLAEDVADEWIITTRRARIKVESMEAASESKCGHRNNYNLNAFAVLTDGSKMCVRSRMGQPEYLVAESLSYWLARFLTLDNVPPVTLAISNHSSWSDVKGVMKSLMWKNDSLLSLCFWMDGIGESKATAKWRRVPRPILQAWTSRVPVTKDTFKGVVLGDLKVDQHNPKSTGNVQSSNMTLQEEIVLMVQWSTMIVFDYIIGNNDRLLVHFRNGRSIEEAVSNNLAVFKTSSKLWLIDNEDGFLKVENDYDYAKSMQHHEKMIKTCCIFQRKVVERLVSLYKESSPWETFLKFAFQQEPILHTVRKEHWGKVISKNTFSARVGQLVRWFEQCEKGPSTK